MKNFTVLGVVTLCLIGLLSCNKEKRRVKNVKKNGCEVEAITALVGGENLFIGNFITPNGDGENEKFIPQCTGVITNYSVTISNNDFGQVFSQQLDTVKANDGWDGYYANGGEYVMDLYDFDLSGQINGTPFSYSGTLVSSGNNSEVYVELCGACAAADGTPTVDDATLKCSI